MESLEDQDTQQNRSSNKDLKKPFYKSKKFKILSLILLSLILLASAGFAGYKYAKSDDTEEPVKTEEFSSSTEKDLIIEESPETAKPISEIYEVNLPEGWERGTCPDNPDILFLAPTTELLGKCQTESFGMVSVSVAQEDTRRTEEYYAADDYYAEPMFSEATVDGLSGYWVSYTIATENIVGYPPVGTYENSLNLYDPSDGKTYIVAYRELPGDPNHRSDFTALALSFNKL
jgi:hypothetical protein